MKHACPGELSRRELLRRVGYGALAIGSTPLAKALAAADSPHAPQADAAGAPRYPGRVVELFGPDVMTDGAIRQDLVDRLLERGMLELTGATTLADAWRRFVAPDDVVGLKVNTLSGPGCSTRREVVQAIVRGVRLAGVPDANIIIWDRFESHLRRTRYAIAQREGALRCYATDSAGVGSDLDVSYQANVLDWIPEPLKKDPVRGFAASYNTSHFSNIFSRHITKQINVPVLKDHNITGVTLALKNVAFGICSNTERFHPTPINCDPMIGEVCAHPMVLSKNVLTIADCLTLLYEGGPTVDPKYLVSYRSLLVGTDMVATDTIGLNIIERIRGEKGLPSLWKTSSPPKHITTAAKLRLGVGEVEAIEHLKLTVPA